MELFSYLISCPISSFERRRVHTQRRHYKLMNDGKKSSMTRDKANALESIGFVWYAKTKKNADKNEEEDIEE